MIDQLIGERGALQMPPIASLVVDSPDVAVVSSWIQAMATDAGAAPLDAGAFDGGERHARDAGEVDAGADSAAADAAASESAAPELDATLGDGGEVDE